MKMSFLGLKGGLKGTDGDIQIPKKAGSIFFLGRKVINRCQISKQKTVTDFFKITARWTLELGGNIANALLFRAKQESGVLMF